MKQLTFFLEELSQVELAVLALKKQHETTWRGRSDIAWLLGLLEEVSELALALNGLHKGPVERELMQIATIAMNWLEYRE